MATTTAHSKIPVLDVSALRENRAADSFLEGLHEALSRYGFFYVSGHGVPESLQTELIDLSREFFAAPLDVKMAIDMKKGGLAWRGYFPPGGELTSGRPDRKEGIYFGRELDQSHAAVRARLPLHGANQWPVAFPRLKELTLEYMKRQEELGHLLMSGIALALRLPVDYFRKRFSEEPTVLFRIFNYQKHVWKDEADEWGVREHTDYGFLTLLRQDDSGGLQVRSREGGWIEAPPIPGTFVVNIGDMLEVWSHGIYKATPHRVRNQGKGDRISLPFFFDPGWNTRLEPIDRTLLRPTDLTFAAKNPSDRWDSLDLRKLPPDLTYGDFLWSKVRKVFPDLG